MIANTSPENRPSIAKDRVPRAIEYQSPPASVRRNADAPRARAKDTQYCLEQVSNIVWLVQLYRVRRLLALKKFWVQYNFREPLQEDFSIRCGINCLNLAVGAADVGT